ncbi:MAG: hypothetical protein GYA14_03815, partial [Ignavibacteria bacterium]|nr:hypothetical protein [Ignavibacteria bacterium]
MYQSNGIKRTDLLSSYSTKSMLRKYSYCGLLLFIIFLLLPITPSAKTLVIGENQKIKSIRAALELSSDGDTLIVTAGFYNEGTLLITKSILLIGMNEPVISGNNKYEIIKVKADNVVIRGFIFK